MRRSEYLSMSKPTSLDEWGQHLRTLADYVEPAVYAPLDRIVYELKYLEKLLRLEGRASEWRDVDELVSPLWQNVSRGAYDQAAEQVSQVEEALSSLKDLARSLTVHYVGHAHMDMNWLWNWPETVRMVVNTLTTIDQLMDEFPDFRFSQSQTAIYDLVHHFDPQLFSRIGRRVREGRWEVTANQWVEGDKNLASDESIIRHILYSKEFFHEQWNVPYDQVQIAFEPDTFGHPQGLPTIFKAAGIRWFYFCRGGSGDTAFRWRAPDGSEVLAWSDFQEWYNGTPTGQEVEAALRFYQETGAHSFLKVYGVGDHGGGPTRRHLRRILTMREWPLFPVIKFAHLADHFLALERERIQLPVVTHELNYVFPGCYSSESETKTLNTESEAGLRTAEGLQSIAHLLNVPLPPSGANLRMAWQDTLFSQFHDILSGSGVPATYTYTLGKGQDVQAAYLMTGNQAMQAVTQSVNIPFCEEGAVPIVVFNPLAWDRDDVVTCDIYEQFTPDSALHMVDSVGHPVPVQYSYDSYLGFPEHQRVRLTFSAKIAGMGYATFFVIPGRGSEGIDMPELFVATRAEGHQVAMLSGKVLADMGLVCHPQKWKLEQLPRDMRLFRQSGVSTYQQGFVITTPWWRAEVQAGHSGIELQSISSADVEPITVGTLEEFLEEPHGMTAWEVGADQMRHVVGGTRWSLMEVGPARIVLQADTAVGQTSHVRISVIFYADRPQLDWDIAVDWREFGTPTTGVPGLAMHFAVPDTGAHAYFGQSTGSVERPIPSRDVPSQGWTAVMANGRGGVIYHPTRYGASVTAGDVGITLLRASYDPDPYAEVGAHHLRLRYAPADAVDSDGFTRESLGMLSPLTGWVSGVHDGILPLTMQALSLKGNVGVITAVKPAEDGDGIIIRIRQDSHQQQELPVMTKELRVSLTPTSLLEQGGLDGEQPSRLNHSLTVPSHGFATFRVRPDPQGIGTH